MKCVVLAVLLTVTQAPSPIPRKATDSAARTSRNINSHSNPNKTPPPKPQPSAKENAAINNENSSNSVRPANTEETIRLRELPPVSVTKDWRDKTYWLFSCILVVVGALGVFAAYKTLRAINRQAGIMEGQTGILKDSVAAAQTSADAAKANTSLTEQTLLLTHRPKIIVRNIEIPGLEKLNRQTPMNQLSNILTGHYTVANVGGLPATIQGVVAGIWAEKGLPMERPDKQGNRLTVEIPLAPGESKEIPSGYFTLTVDDTLKVIDSEVDAYLMVQIEYVDAANIRRKTSACRKFDRTIQRFVRIDDPDYEYAD